MLINNICEHLSKRIETGELSNDDMVQIIEHIGGYLILRTIAHYARAERLSYSGAKKFRQVRKIFNVKFVIDNI
jgi:hypothetical protein